MRCEGPDDVDEVSSWRCSVVLTDWPSESRVECGWTGGWVGVGGPEGASVAARPSIR